MHRYRSWVLLGGVCLLAGCATPIKVTRGGTIGTYEARYKNAHGKPFAKETLVLNSNGTYEQTFIPMTGKGWKHAGQWTLDNSQGSSRIWLDDYWEAVDYDGAYALSPPQKAGGAGLPIEERAGVICITKNPDADTYYAKMK